MKEAKDEGAETRAVWPDLPEIGTALLLTSVQVYMDCTIVHLAKYKWSLVKFHSTPPRPAEIGVLNGHLMICALSMLTSCDFFVEDY
jgi:hypothetical protein